MQNSNPRVSRTRRGQGLVEYALLLGAIAVVVLLSVSLLGHKSNDIVATLAVTLPGAHSDDNLTIDSGELVESKANAANDTVIINATSLATAAPGGVRGTERLGTNAGFGTDLDSLVKE